MLGEGSMVGFQPSLNLLSWVPLCRSQPVLLYPWPRLGMASIGKGKRLEGLKEEALR